MEKLLKDDPHLSYQVDIIVRLFDAKKTLRTDTTEQALKNHLHKIKTNKAFTDRLENNNHFMLKNYFKIAWRNITRHKVYTAINVFGLALGICACITIYLVTKFDLSFDKFHPDGNRIYRIVGELQNDKGDKEFLNSVINDVAAFQNQIPGFEAKAGLIDYGENVTIPDGNKPPKKFDNRIAGSYNTSTIITWPEYFGIFKYKWLAGNPQTLSEPFKVVLTENRARKYFGNIPINEMIGKTVIYQDSLRVNVSGIIKDWTENTDFGYTDFISISTATHSFLKQRFKTEDWSILQPHNSLTMVKLDNGVTANEINKRFAAFIKDYVKFQQPGTKLTMYLQPLTDIHFTKEFRRGDDGDDFRKAYMPTLYSLMGVAVFILLIAAVNFINLSTAQSIQRAKEIGVRKVLGSNRLNITFQFLTETFVLTVLAAVISVLLVNPVLALFKDYIPEGIEFHIFNLSTFLFLFGVILITTVFAGFYPARVLASYLPVLSLKGVNFQKGSEKINLRKALIVFQFTISMLFIITAIIMGKQMNFMKNADKGFNSDAIITVDKWRDHDDKLKILAENVRHIPGIDKVLWQGNNPMGFAKASNTFKFKGKEEITINPVIEEGDDHYISFYKMKLVAGRDMIPGDSLHELIINETMAKAIGFTNPADAVGKQLFNAFNTTPQVANGYPIVGVVADFHQGSLHDAIEPAIITNMKFFRYRVAIKLSEKEKNTKDVKTILAAVETEWKKIFPDETFNYQFMNESIGFLYGQEEKTAWLVNVAMGLTIFISCMGLFGLGMFTAERRTKEIGIRKVLGASVANITAMLSRDFVSLIILSIVIASPVAWYFMNQWLQDYAYRTNISWWVFIIAGGFAIFFGLITVSFHAIKAAMANPVKSLRNE
ncbi:MAG: ABC transporter permease [Bacteroidetes bacterium]|nr:ABC transporter permease [Bacteroidota bacterium]